MPIFSHQLFTQRWAVPTFFGSILLIGLFLYRDYGISIDEEIERVTGMTSLRYVAEKVAPEWTNADPVLVAAPDLSDYKDRDYGVAFQLPVSLIERLFNFEDGRAIYLLRHLCTFLVWWGGLIALYQLSVRRFQDWRWGLLAPLLMLLTPRMFAESFYNCKDAVFMAVFAIALNTVARFVISPTIKSAIVCAIGCAVAIDVRIMGVILPAATVALLLWRGLRREVSWSELIRTFALYLSLLWGLIIAFWPYLWAKPIRHFITAFENMSAFRWGGNVLYLGDTIPATDLPWHYASVWIGLTTPLPYLIAGVAAIILIVWRTLHNKWRLWANEYELQDLLFLGVFLAPLLAVIVLHSVLYDGWRQLYFIYPAFLLLAIRSWVGITHRFEGLYWWNKSTQVIGAVFLLFMLAQLVWYHPLQNVYFNALAGSNIDKQMEMDYWGLGYLKDLEYISNNDSRSNLKLYAPGPSSAKLNLLLLPAEKRTHLQFADSPEEADYFLTSYRGHPEDYSYPNEVYQLRIAGHRLHSVFRLK